MKRVLILSFYYPPDLSAGSFRVESLLEALLEDKELDVEFVVITTMPNRYQTFNISANHKEEFDRLKIFRVELPEHQSGMLDQSLAYFRYVRGTQKIVNNFDFDLVVATSSRLMTAWLGSNIAKKKSCPLYLDLRDIFVDTMQDILPKYIALFLLPILSMIEKTAVARACHINLVSKGFNQYFKNKYPNKQLSFYTNGIDEEFLARPENQKQQHISADVTTILYAGNIGEGQGLHEIIPFLAKRLEGEVKFILVGDGGKRQQLVQKIAETGCTNVEIVKPVQRSELIRMYNSADVFFLHLNNLKAFEKVLPSKLFEYAALGKPIWAGVSGYAAEFIGNEIINAAVFTPCDIESSLQVFRKLKLEHTARHDFIKKYKRSSIMSKMSRDILAILG